MSLAEGQVTPESKYVVAVENGNLALSFLLDTAGVDAQVKVILAPDYFLAKLKEAIPGKIDDTIIDIIAVAIKGVK